jgi:hypothetical protein
MAYYKISHHTIYINLAEDLPWNHTSRKASFTSDSMDDPTERAGTESKMLHGGCRARGGPGAAPQSRRLHGDRRGQWRAPKQGAWASWWTRCCAASTTSRWTFSGASAGRLRAINVRRRRPSQRPAKVAGSAEAGRMGWRRAARSSSVLGCRARGGPGQLERLLHGAWSDSYGWPALDKVGALVPSYARWPRTRIRRAVLGKQVRAWGGCLDGRDGEWARRWGVCGTRTGAFGCVRGDFGIAELHFYR